MIPVFGEVFSEPIPAYFTMLAGGFALCIFVLARWAKRSGLDHDVMIDLGLLMIVTGVLGARLLHVVADGYFWDYVHLCTDPSQVVYPHVESRAECLQLGARWQDATCLAAERDCFAWAAFWNGGLAYYGGLLVAAPAAVWFLRREAFPVWKALDALAMVVPLGLFFGRMGCFFAGCCFGTVTAQPPGVSFPAWSPASSKHYELGLLPSKTLPSLPVHPTQLYEAGGALAIAALLALWVQPRKRFDGQVACVLLACYAVLRFGLEFLRADDRGGLFGLSTSQLIGVLIMAVTAWAWVWLRGRARRLQGAPGLTATEVT